MKASSLAPSLSIISHVAIGSEKKILKTYTQHQNNFIESTIKYVMYIIYLTIYVSVICINLMKTWAPLRVIIFLWLALRRAIGQEIGGWDMVWRLGNYASCVTKSKRWLTTSLLNSCTPGTFGTISSKCSAGNYRNWHQQPWAGGDDYGLRVRPTQKPRMDTMFALVSYSLGRYGKSAMPDASGDQRPLSPSSFRSSRMRATVGLMLAPAASVI